MASQRGAANHSATNASPPTCRPVVQYSLAAIIWWTTTLAISLAYLRFHSLNSLLLGAVSIGIAALVGLAVGWTVQRPLDVCSWAVFGVVFPYTSVLTSSFADETPYVISWLAVGALAGITAAVASGTWPRRATIVAAMAWMPIGVVWITGTYPVALLLEAFCAAIAGAAFALLFEVILALESKYGLKRYVSTCGIVLLSIAISSAGSQLVEAW